MLLKTILWEVRESFLALVCPRKTDLAHYLILSTAPCTTGPDDYDGRELIEYLESVGRKEKNKRPKPDAPEES